MPKKEIIVIGTSAGGVEALKRLVAAMPEGLGASIFVVQHTSRNSPGILAEILDRAGDLRAVNPSDQQEILPGVIYVAPPDHHLLLEHNGHVRIMRGPKENGFRPAVDPLFRSAARAFGPRVVGVVLTGGLDDGTAGLLAIKRRGGTAVVQDPKDAFDPSMPLNALRHVRVDYCLPLAEIPLLLVRLATEPAEEEGAYPVTDDLDVEVKIAREDKATDAGVMKLGEPSIFTCPECHGTLLELKKDDFLSYRCHTGHAFSPGSLLAELTQNIENSLWTAIRSIQESVMLLRRLAEQVNGGEQKTSTEMLLQKAEEAERRADLVRQVVMHHEKQGSGAGGQESGRDT
jgi:two-component system, chemotaxis family, protein-glutamate methylesterase/glutaminase